MPEAMRGRISRGLAGKNLEGYVPVQEEKYHDEHISPAAASKEKTHLQSSPPPKPRPGELSAQSAESAPRKGATRRGANHEGRQARSATNPESTTQNPSPKIRSSRPAHLKSDDRRSSSKAARKRTQTPSP